ncbi:uncharacterized protein H6S33_000038 [Morchella sextelata]|uniref:uncharacterized protein n=1 Tax=Morchella sextelata TaxID=1174677 RepID=UPI001D052C94|nr:uncharacterized protein H6S33_000038 [Morchella sextelata]KAH0614402.1 hypothetical protein H6S33_000038 [Morchella sextelata]
MKPAMSRSNSKNPPIQGNASQKPPLNRGYNSTSRILSRQSSRNGKAKDVIHDGSLFGTCFGVVLTAANDLVGNSAPPGLILFAYTLPSVLVRTFVPYIKFPKVSDLLSYFYSPQASDYWRAHTPGGIHTPGTPSFGLKKGDKVSQEINYAARLSVCAASSFLGLQMLAWADNVGVRMLGIAFASLSSNLGDMSFYQLATRYPSMISRSFGGYAAGSGAAGLVGSFIYTLLTSSFGVTPSAVLSGIGIVPSIMLMTYFFVLPSPKECDEAALASGTDIDEIQMEEVGGAGKEEMISDLKLGDKLRLVRPMVIGYMAPLAILMFLENITTQGILPTIIYHLPFSSVFTPSASLLNTIFTSTRSFYPFFFTTYQFAIFFGRTSITLFRLPGGNSSSSFAYWILCAIESVIFVTMLNQSWSMLPSSFTENPDGNVLFSPFVVMALIFTMGLCGGLGMSNTYWRVSKKPLPDAVWNALDKARSKRLRKKERSFDTQEDGISTPLDGEQDGYFAPRPRLRKLVSMRGSAGERLLSEEMEEPGSEASVNIKRSQEEETAVREFLISTIALPDTFAIMVASIVSMWLQPELCRWQVQGGRDLCKVG